MEFRYIRNLVKYGIPSNQNSAGTVFRRNKGTRLDLTRLLTPPVEALPVKDSPALVSGGIENISENMQL